MGPQALKVLSRGCSGKTHLWGQMIENPNREKNRSPPLTPQATYSLKRLPSLPHQIPLSHRVAGDLKWSRAGASGRGVFWRTANHNHPDGSPDGRRMLSVFGDMETRVHATPVGQVCPHFHFLLQVTRSQQFPRSPGVGASSIPSSAVSAEMMGSPCLPTVGLPSWWRKMAPSLRFVVVIRNAPGPSRKWTWQLGV